MEGIVSILVHPSLKVGSGTEGYHMYGIWLHLNASLVIKYPLEYLVDL